MAGNSGRNNSEHNSLKPRSAAAYTKECPIGNAVSIALLLDYLNFYIAKEFQIIIHTINLHSV